MLGFRWIATHAGAPDSGAFRTAVDSLRDKSGATEFQAVPKLNSDALEPSTALQDVVSTWVKNLNGAAAVVLVHGYSYDPETEYEPHDGDDAFNGVYANPRDLKIPYSSWLPIVGETDEEGNALKDVAVPFSWTSTGSFSHYGNAAWSNPYQYAVLDLAVQAARSLKLVICALARAGATVDILAHSLGTRLTLQTLALLADQGMPNVVRRVVLMGGAEFSIDARDSSKKGGFDAFNLVNRSDSVLKWGATKMIHPFRQVQTVESRVIGRDGMRADERWIDIQIDRDTSDQRAAFDQWFMAHYNTTLSEEPAGGRGRHWGYYMQSCNRIFLKALFSSPTVTAAGLREAGLIEGVIRYDYGILPDPVPPTPQTAAARLKANHEAAAALV